MIRKLSAITVLLGVVVAAFISSLTSQPSFNGPTPGCGSGGGCHTFRSGIVSASLPGGLAVQITVNGAGGNVAGELVDTNGAVVSVNNSTSSNPFTLIAPYAGRFTVNAGYKDPTREWDSREVDIVVTAIGDNQSSLPEYFQLGQNYPNPFNPTTAIEYSIPVRSQVTVKVYDLRGRKVATLVDGFEEPGTKTVTFDANGIASGVYLYRLQAGAHTETKHLVVMR